MRKTLLYFATAGIGLFFFSSSLEFVSSQPNFLLKQSEYQDDLLLTETHLYKNPATKRNNLVMVSANRYTMAGKLLREHPDAIGVFSPKDGFYDQVLFDFDESTQRDEIASFAHSENAACGSLIPLMPGASLALTTAATSSFWSTAVSLSNVSDSLAQLSKAKLDSAIQTLEALGTRHHSSSNALLAVSTVKAMWTANLPAAATVEEVSNSTSSSQNNVVVSLPGSTDNSTTVIIGAHIDSINRVSSSASAPGADDDATGLATINEVLRVIKEKNLTFARRVEFHGYGAEEVGLIGSANLAKKYAQEGRKVAGMIQLDMNGFSSSADQNTIFLVTKDTSPVITKQMKDLISAYQIASVVEGTLTAGTSDHYSWNASGFHSGFPFENPSAYNSSIHTDKDTLTKLDTSLSLKHAKLALAWLSHVAGVVGVESEHASKVASLDASGANLKVAVVNGDAASSSRFVTSLGDSVTAVSSCRVSAKDDGSCIEAPNELQLEGSENGRVYFVSSADLQVDAGLIVKFTAYDKTGAAVAQRSIKFLDKNAFL
jgi:leucyl aminopeptidase